MEKKNIALNIIAIILVLYVLKIEQAMFLPFVAALFFWCLIYILNSFYKELIIDKWKFPEQTKYILRPLAILTIGGIAYFTIIGIKNNLADVATTFTTYQQNIAQIIENISTYFNLENKIDTAAIVKSIDLPKLINYIVQGFAGFVSNTTMILLYIMFLMLEEQSIINKVPLLFKNSKKVKETFGEIFKRIRIYMLVKTLVSLATGMISYLIMRSVGLDFAMFWAILIFLLNFIPTIGSIVSSIFPILLSLLQFNNTYVPFIILSVGLILTQIIIGNIIDPKLTGKRLNLSPLVLILSLVVWGNIWGVMGMFLSVPIMIIITIVLHQIPKTKKIAILLTEDGKAL